MFIQKISCQGFRAYKELNISLDGKSLVLFGINGAGKSTVLAIINFLFAIWLKKLGADNGRVYEKLTNTDIHIDQNTLLPCPLSLQGLVSFGDAEFALEREYVLTGLLRDRKNKTSVKQYNDFTDYFENEYGIAEKNMPVFVSYATNRSVLDIPVRIRTKHNFNKLSALDNAIDSAVDFRVFFEWFRDREDLENQEIKKQLDFSYKDKQLECVRRAITEMIGYVKNLHVERNPLSLMVDKDGVSVQVDFLSDGEKCTLALIGDLARRLAIANPSADNPLEGEGIVAIDEIELHMHPQWQRRVLSVLRTTFPNIQFIVTTHSPQVLSELDDSYKIVSLTQIEGSVVADEVGRLDGQDVNYILETCMKADSKKMNTKRLIRTIESNILAANYSDAENGIGQLENIAGTHNDAVITLKGFLNRRRLADARNKKN